MHSALFEEDDDLFAGSPKSKFMDIVFNASRDSLEQELVRIIERQAVMELLLAEHCGEELECKISRFKSENPSEIENFSKTLYAQSVENVLQHKE